MKKVITSLLVAMVVLIPGTAKADNITAEQAQAAAATYLSQNFGQADLTAADMLLVRQIDNPSLGVPAAYFFNARKSGWVIMAATTVIDPIIAFSPEGTLDTDDLPTNMMWWVGKYAENVSLIQQLDAEKNLPDSKEWLTLKSGKPQAKADAAKVLMTEYWHQGSTTSPNYNLYCPVIGGRTSVVGCVATALGQMCHYYRYPVKPKGTTRVYSVSGVGTIRLKYDTISFDYSLMPDGLGNNSTREQIQEVAKLCYALGVAVKMSYHPDGSGSNNAYTIAGMRDIFKYNEPVLKYRSTTGNEAFVNAIREELLKKNPIFMTGASSTGGDDEDDAAGHAWVCCGYRTENLKQYYMNWGWGGSTRGNGFYNLGDNNMYMSYGGYNFNVEQSALIGMTPPDDSNRFVVGIRDVDGTSLAPAYPNPAAVSVSIPYSLESASDLCIYGMDGRLVAKVNVPAGNGEATLSVTELPAGIYVYRLNNAAGKFIVK